jgi:phosphatidyl-myo-inositol dimannoside synthase
MDVLTTGDVTPQSNCHSCMVLLSEIFPPQAGGSGRWFWETYSRLDSDRVRIITGHYSGDDVFDRTHRLRLQRMPLTFRETGTLSFSGMWNYWSVVRRLLAMHRAEPIGMLHCGRCITEGWVGWLFQRLTGVPYLSYVHGEDVNISSDRSAFGVMSSRQHRWMGKRVLRDARVLIANSENSRMILESAWKIPTDRIRVVNPGVDVSRFRPADPDLAVREALGWGNRPVVLTVGRLQKRKGHDMLIRALPEIRAQIPNVLYVIVGNGEELSSLQELVKSFNLSDHVQFRIGTSDEELIRCYQQCDLFVLPNRTIGHDIEGFGMVLVEAQACGKPVVAGDSGGTRETMLVPETGRIVRCEGGPELGQTLIQLLSDLPLLRTMGLAANNWAHDQFAWDAVVKRMDSIFHEAVAAR